MPEQLFERLAHLRQRLRYVLWVYGLCWLTVVFFSTSLIAGSMDWLWHLDDPGVRLLLELSIFGGTVWTGWRFLWRPLKARMSDVDLASRIERFHPDMSDSLSSTVEFLESGQNEAVGSPQLQGELIRRTLQQVEDVEVTGILDTRPVQRVAWWAVAACVLVGTTIGFNQVEASTAISRLFFPFSSTPWPRDVELRFVDQEFKPLAASTNGALTVVQGETLELFVENMRGDLPSDLKLVYRKADGRTIREPMRQATLRDADGTAREIGGATLHVTSGPLFFWAQGGDGETPPLQVDVVPPPRVDRFQIRVTAPAYTAIDEVSLSENVGDVTGFVGTRIQLTGSSNKPLGKATLHRSNAASQSLAVLENGTDFSGEFTLTSPGNGSWWIVLRDRQGFENPEAPRYQLQASPDVVPTVLIEQPESDQLVTPDARIPIHATARDDLAVKALLVEWESSQVPASSDAVDTESDIGTTEPLELSKNPEATSLPDAGADSSAAFTGRIPLSSDSERNELVHGETVWDLQPFGWQPGTRIVIRAVGTDWYDLGEPHIGRSNPRALTIVSPEEKRAELADRQSGLVLDLERVTAAQKKSREVLGELQVQLDQTGTLRDHDLDLLKRIELDQRQIEDRLTNETDGLTERARSIQQERVDNGVEDTTAHELLGTLAGELDFLKNGPLPEIERKLTEARKLSDTEVLDSKKTQRRLESALDTVAGRQEETHRTLSNLLDDLSRWRSERNLNAGLRSLTGEQRELAERAAEIGRKTQGRNFAELDTQDRADLAKTAERQQQIADQIDDLKEELKESAETLSDSNHEQAARMNEAAEKLEESGLAGKMRETSSQLSRNRVGDATKNHQEILEELRKIQDVLDNREVSDTESLVKQLDEAARNLAAVRQYAEGLQKKIDEAAQAGAEADEQQLEKLQRQQRRVREMLEENVRRLQRLQSPSAGAADRSAGRMQQAEDALADGDAGDAHEQLEEALDDLEQAERELAADQRQAEESLAREQLEKIADQLDSLIARQNEAIAETKRLSDQFEERGRWSRTLLKSLRNHVNVQKSLSEETRNQASDLKAVEVIKLALEGASSLMDRAVSRLDERDVSGKTVKLQERARDRFLALREAMKEDPDANRNPESQEPDEGNPPGQDSGPAGESVSIIAQLRILRALQTDLIDRVEAIRTRVADSSRISDEDKTELQAISEEQEHLADLARELTSYFGEAEDIEQLPIPGNLDDAEGDPATPDVQ